jgi:hypothetical protein
VTESTELSDRPRLLRALTLSKQYHLYIVSCPTPRSADNLVEWLARELPRARGEDVEIERLDPHRGRRDSAGLARHEVTRHVLEPLLRQDQPARGRIVIVDASRAQEGDDDAWRWFFSRWNEQRNAVQLRLRAELLLLLPPRLTNSFARTAPDVWSTRSGEYESAYELDTELGLEASNVPAAQVRSVAADLPERLARLGPQPKWNEELKGVSAVSLQTGFRERIELGQTALRSLDLGVAERLLAEATHYIAALAARSGAKLTTRTLGTQYARALELYARVQVERGELARASAVLKLALYELPLSSQPDAVRLHSELDIVRLAADVALAESDFETALDNSRREIKLVGAEALLIEQPRAQQRRAAIEMRRADAAAAERHIQRADELLGQLRELLEPSGRDEMIADIADTWSDVLSAAPAARPFDRGEQPQRSHEHGERARELAREAVRLRRMPVASVRSSAKLYASLLRLARLELRSGQYDRAALEFEEGLQAALGSQHYLDWLEALRLTHGIDLATIEPNLPALIQAIQQRMTDRVADDSPPSTLP